jgi:antitoxin component YwqK of YwqJK toxin-antitoxin module
MDVVFNGVLRQPIQDGFYIVGFYLNGKKEGVFKTCFPNGQLSRTEQYFDGLKHGISNFYKYKINQPGEIYLCKTELYVNDSLAEQKEFYENGKVSEHTKFKNNQKNGPMIEYYENGIIKSTYNYVNDKIEGEVVYYHDNGVIKEKKYYTLGWMERRNREEFYSNGQVALIINWYNDPNNNGFEKKFYPNGELKYLANYINGLMEGEFFEYHDNGQVKVAGYYVNDKKHGTFTKYFKNGRVQQVSNYVRNKLSGEFKKYNYRSGDIIANYRHLNGRRLQEPEEQEEQEEQEEEQPEEEE